MVFEGTFEDKNLYVVFIRGVVLTKDDLLRCNWHGDSKCAFCHSDESIQHLFFACHYA
jgi:hypothetical protein